MGTSITGYLTPAQIARTQTNQTAMVSAGSSLPPPPRPFIFLAAFDGTNNDKNNVALSGSPYQTNVASIYDQAVMATKTNTNLAVGYYTGVGTGSENGGLLQAAFSPTQAIHFSAEKALIEFSVAADKYLKDNLTATYADLSATTVGFSRGGITAIVFARLLNERGLVLGDGTVVAPPGVAVYGLVPIDPVKSGIEGDLSIPPNVKGDVLQLVSMGEDRKYFELADLGNDARVVSVEVYNNHVGSGGGDDRNGTAASVLEGVTEYLKNQGTAIADVPPDMRFDPSKPVAIRSEAYQTAANGDVLLNEDGTPKLKWPVAGTPDKRETVPIPVTGDTHDPRDPHSARAVNGADHQSDTYLGSLQKTYLSLLELSAPELANQFKDLYEQAASGQVAAPVEMPVMPGTLIVPNMEFFEARCSAMQTFAQQVETDGLQLVAELVTAFQSDNQAAMRAAVGQSGAWGQQVNSEFSALMAGLKAADLGGGYSAGYGAGGGTQTDPLPAVDAASWPMALLAGQALSQASAWHYTVPADMLAPRPAGAYAWPASVSPLEHSAWSFDGMRSALSDDEWANTLNYLATDALTGAPPVGSEGSRSLANQLTGNSAANVNDLLLYWAGNAQNSVSIQDVWAQSSVVPQALIESVKFDNRAAWGVGALL